MVKRELKFRIWDEKNNCWIKDHIQYYPEKEMLKQGHTIQQFTGLKDSKSVDIYEGDLLEFAYRDDGKQFVGEVQYFEKFGSFGVVVDNAFETFQDLIEYDQFFNVVGNIFENENSNT